MQKACLSFLFLFLPIFVYAQNIPQPEGWVNDFANVISQEYRDKLTALIQELEEKTTSEIAVVTVNSIAPLDEKEYARLLFDNWKPGKIGKDNGVLVLLAIKERRWRIETGYGVEGILPDGLCGEIGRNYMVPYFKDQKFGEGLYNGVAKIANVLGVTTEVSPAPRSRNENVNQSRDIIIWGILLLIAFLSAIPWKLYFSLLVLTIIAFVLFRLFSLIAFIIVFFVILAILKVIFTNGINNRSSYGGWGYGGGGGFGGGGGGFGGGGGGGGGAGGGF